MPTEPAQKKYLSMFIQGSPSGCVRREIPGVTQVAKGHEGNSSSHNLPGIYVGGNMECIFFHEE